MLHLSLDTPEGFVHLKLRSIAQCRSVISVLMPAGVRILLASRSLPNTAFVMLADLGKGDVEVGTITSKGTGGKVRFQQVKDGGWREEEKSQR